MSFIRNYMTYVKRDEAHPDYHLWTAFVVLASLVGRKVWIVRPYQRVFANLYVILVGPQGNRKTAAKTIGQNFMKAVGGVSFSSESTSREDLIKKMSEQQVTFEHNGTADTYAPMTICVTEFKEFLALDPVRMLNFITAAYDVDFYDYSVRGRAQKDVIYNPYLNILACETPQWLSDRLKEGIVSGGFSRRVAYIYQTTHFRYVDKELPKECKEAYDFILKDAARIKELVGEFKFSPALQVFYDSWYQTYKIHEDPAMVGFYESKHTLATKLAMLISVSEGNSLMIEKEHFELALTLLDNAEKNMTKVFAGSGRNELAAVAIKVADALERAGQPMPEDQILVALFHDCRDVREVESVLAHLTRSGKAVRYSVNGVKYLSSLTACPPSVLQQLKHVVESKSDLAASSSPPLALSSIPSDLDAPFLAAQQPPPSASVEPRVEPPKVDSQPLE